MRTCKARPMHWGSSIDLLHSRNAQGQDGGELLTDADLAPVREPSKRWRNEWKVLRIVMTSAGIVHPGTILVSDQTWPSYELAEQAAIEATQMGVADGLSLYLGPVADSE